MNSYTKKAFQFFIINLLIIKNQEAKLPILFYMIAYKIKHDSKGVQFFIYI
jgi:hypothetical protein